MFDMCVWCFFLLVFSTSMQRATLCYFNEYFHFRAFYDFYVEFPPQDNSIYNLFDTRTNLMLTFLSRLCKKHFAWLTFRILLDISDINFRLNVPKIRELHIIGSTLNWNRCLRRSRNSYRFSFLHLATVLGSWECFETICQNQMLSKRESRLLPKATWHCDEKKTT